MADDFHVVGTVPVPSHVAGTLRVPSASRIIVALLISVFAHPAHAQTASRRETRDVRFVAGLRELQQYDLAERWTTERLTSSSLTDAERTELVVELVRTYALHAANAAAEKQENLWFQAKKTADDYLRVNPPPPRVELVRVQQALAALAQGELDRIAWETRGGDELATAAQTRLRDARRRLEDAQSLIAALVLERRRLAPDEDELTVPELTSLGQHVVAQQARALRNLALTFPPRDDNRLALLLEAMELVKKGVAQVAGDDPLAGTLRLEWLTAARLARQREQLAEVLPSLMEENIPSDVRLAALAEAMRAAMEEDDLELATRLFQQGRTRGGTQPEFELAYLELAIAQWKRAAEMKQAAASKDWQKRAVDAAKFLEQTHGKYWGRRADQLLIAAAPNIGGGTTDSAVDILRRTADSLFVKGQLIEAIAAYDKGAESAAAADAKDLAFELAYKAAAVQQQRGEHADASRRLQTLSESNTAHPAAADAHLLAAWNLAQVVRVQPEELPQYVQVLLTHQEHWPTHPSAQQGLLWLGRAREGQQAWRSAVEAYQRIAPDSPHFAAAVAALGPCWRQQLEELRSKGKPTQRPVQEAEQFCRQIILGDANAWPQEWTSAQRTLALAWGELAIEFRPEGAAAAEKTLQAALQGTPSPDRDWQRSAEGLLIVLLAANPANRTAAREKLQQLGDASTAELLSITDRLTQIGQRSQVDVQKGIAELQLQTVAQLRTKAATLKPEQLATLDRVEAQAFATAGKRDQAIAAFGKLVGKYPQDGAIQEAFAQLLSQGTERKEWETGLGQWRKIAARSQPQSARWYRAKYAVADLQQRLGDAPAAVQLIRYLQETPPGLPAEWQGPFEQLLKKCER